MKKYLTLLFMLIPMLSWAAPVKIDGIWYNINQETKAAEVTNKTGGWSTGTNSYSGSITIPESVVYNGTTCSVTSIGDYAFYGCKGLTSITIPNSVTSIGEWAFWSCSGLTSITIPNSVTSIGNYAFSGCSGLTSVTIPNSVTSIGNFAFSSCKGLTSIDIPNSVTSIGIEAFSGCSGLTSIVVEDGNTKYDSRDNCNCLIETATNTLLTGCKNSTIPNSVTSIEEYAFSYCKGLTSITIPNSVTSIGDDAFYHCERLTSVTIPNSVTSIGNSAFSGCSGLTSITIPNSVTSIGVAAFYGCSGLTSVTIGNSVTSIGESTFHGCSGLTSVSIPNSVTSIGSNAFRDCSGLTSITIGNSVTSIRDGAFYNCSGLTSVTIPNSVTSIWSDAFYECSGLTSITIGNSVTNIDNYAFWGCSGLTSVTIPSSVTSIWGAAFGGCSGLTSIKVATNNSKYDSRDNCNAIVETATNTLLTGCKNSTIPNSVTSIGEWAFEYCSGLTSVTIPNSVTSIGYRAFYQCSGLTSVSIGSGVEGIGAWAFAYCKNLETVTCLADKVPSTNSNAFKDSYIEYATLRVPDQSVDLYRAASPWSSFGTIEACKSTIDLVDGTDYTGDTDVECDELTYTRTFNNTNWQALYVPFSMSFEDWDSQGLEVARLNGYYEYDDDKNGTIDRACLEVLMVTEGEGDLKPNHPYMVRAKSTGKKTIALNNTTLYAAASNSIDCSTMETKYTFTGIYEQKSKASLNAINAYGMSGGSLKQAGGALSGFRWYMVRESRGGQLLPVISEVKVHVIGMDEEDGIEMARQDRDDEVAYNLMGQRVDGNAKGIIIKNGKKIFKNK